MLIKMDKSMYTVHVYEGIINTNNTVNTSRDNNVNTSCNNKHIM